MSVSLVSSVMAPFAPVASPLQLGAECAHTDETYIVKRMVQLIKQITQQDMAPKGAFNYPRRFNQAKTLGYFEAEFDVLPDLPESLAQGLFATPARYAAHIRFASASTDDDRKKDLRGVAIKLHKVPGSKLWGRADQQDFVLNSYPVLFAGTPQDFLAFIEATVANKRWWYFINPQHPHWRSLQILLLARANHTSPFDIPYWSTTPYRFGKQTSVAVKYKLIPSSDYSSQLPWRLTANYLRQNMHKHLAASPVCFDLAVQFQLHAGQMPIEDASVLWPESVSPYHRVARIRIQPQDFAWQDFPGSAAFQMAERQSFNPWQALTSHQPLGGINRVRQQVYAELASFRQQFLAASNS